MAGEVCHFVDLLQFSPEKLYATQLLREGRVLADDNVSNESLSLP